jgi:F-type H+-transporting ATPase subunit b
MNINVTLIVQMIVFAMVVWFSMKFIWPLIMQAIEERNKTISEGLAAAEQGQKKLIDAESEASVLVKKARKQASTILDQANNRATSIMEEAKTDGEKQRSRIIVAAQEEATQETAKLKEGLRAEIASLAVAGAEKILTREIKAADHETLLKKLAKKIK